MLRPCSRRPGAACVFVTFATFLTLFGAISASAETVVIPTDRDATLYQNPSGRKANGAGKYMFVGKTNGDTLRRALVHFDLESWIPPGSTIHSAELRLRLSRTTCGVRRVTLHHLLESWGEGASNASGSEGRGDDSEPGDATWVHRSKGESEWSTPGGHFDSAPSASLLVDGANFYSFSSERVTNEVVAWHKGQVPNHGWLLKGKEDIDERSTKRFDTKENGTRDNRPVLVVSYTAPDLYACRTGTVDLAGAGAPQDVLFVNGEAGDRATRTVDVAAGTSIQVSMVASESGPVPSRFVLYLNLGAPIEGGASSEPAGLGTMCFPSPLTGGAPHRVWNNMGHEPQLGVPDFPSSPAPSIVAAAPVGKNLRAVATLQGFLLDSGSAADVDVSVSNAIVVRIE